MISIVQFKQPRKFLISTHTNGHEDTRLAPMPMTPTLPRFYRHAHGYPWVSSRRRTCILTPRAQKRELPGPLPTHSYLHSQPNGPAGPTKKNPDLIAIWACKGTRMAKFVTLPFIASGDGQMHPDFSTSARFHVHRRDTLAAMAAHHGGLAGPLADAPGRVLVRPGGTQTMQTETNSPIIDRGLLALNPPPPREPARACLDHGQLGRSKGACSGLGKMYPSVNLT